MFVDAFAVNARNLRWYFLGLLIVSEGIDIARQRIAKEAVAKTEFLDLGQLSLSRLSNEQFALDHLQALNLGAGYLSESGDYLEAEGDIAPNSVGNDLSQLRRFPDLQALHLRMASLTSLVFAVDLQSLSHLACTPPGTDRHRVMSSAHSQSYRQDRRLRWRGRLNVGLPIR